MTARIAAGAYSGRVIAGLPGAAGGAAGAFTGAYATWRARKLVVAATGLPDPVVAVGEDLLAYSAAALATHTGSPAEPLQRSLVRGLAAGVCGTLAMTIAQGAEFVLTSAKPSDAPATVADKLKRRAGLRARQAQARGQPGDALALRHLVGRPARADRRRDRRPPRDRRPGVRAGRLDRGPRPPAAARRRRGPVEALPRLAGAAKRCSISSTASAPPRRCAPSARPRRRVRSSPR